MRNSEIYFKGKLMPTILLHLCIYSDVTESDDTLKHRKIPALSFVHHENIINYTLNNITYEIYFMQLVILNCHIYLFQ